MTVAELIKALQALPQDLPVRYYDYEEGGKDVMTAETDFDHYRNDPTLRPASATHVVLGCY